MKTPSLASAAASLLPLLLAACASSAPPPPPASPSTAPTTASATGPQQGVAASQPGATPAPAAGPATPAAPATAAAPAMSAPAGDDLVDKAAPDFTAKAQDGSTVHLSALKGKTVVLYFYPKDETAGCTKEACSFRDSWTALAKTGAVLVGVSADTLDSHKEFVQHYKLPFLLVSDPDGSIGHSYGVPFQGHHQRQTIIVGADGKVRKVYRTVDVSVHASQVLDDLSHMST